MATLINKLSIKNIYLIILIVNLTTALFSVGFHHPDEQYYTIDFALLKLGYLTDTHTTWELESNIRPWLLPTLYMPFIYIFKSILNIESPFIISTFLRITSAIFSVGAIYIFNLSTSHFYRSLKTYKLAIIITNLTWFIPYMNVRTSSDNIGFSFFLIALAFFINYLNVKNLKSLIISTFFAALAFGIRHQIGLLIFCIYFGSLLSRKINLKDWIIKLCLPLLAFLAIPSLIDIWGYNEFVFTPYNYVKVNILEGKASSFGTSPFWYYLTKTVLDMNPLIGIVFLASLFFQLINFKKNLICWTTIPFLIVHCLISHKENRFIYPVIFLSLVYAIVYIERLYNKGKLGNYFYSFMKITFASNLLYLFVIMFKPAYTPLLAYKHIWKENISKLYVLKDRKGKYPSLEMPFYKRKSLNVIQANNIGKLKNESYLLTTKYSDLSKLANKHLKCERIYQSYPNFILELNIFGWRDRSNIWAVTKCK